MATQELVTEYALYVVGEVESGWTWNSATLFDGVSNIITIGMTQEAGSNAQALLLRIHDGAPDSWAAIEEGAPQLASDVLNWPQTWSAWSGRALTETEAQTLRNVLGNEECVRIQQEMWSDQCDGYTQTAQQYGLSLDNPKVMIYFYSMMHQSPAQAVRVLSTAGGQCDLLRIHTVRANDPVLSAYTNRYNTVYGRLSEWDGESAPPDFGQDEFPSDEGGNVPGISGMSSALGYIIQVGDTLYLYGKGQYSGGVPFYKASAQTWVNGKQSEGAPIEGEIGGGGDPNENASKTADWCEERVGTWQYIWNGSRYDPDSSVPKGTDCSGMVIAAYWQVLGIDLGSWTGMIATTDVLETVWHGTGASNVPYDVMERGDVMVCTTDPNSFMTRPTESHAAIYTGTPGQYVHTRATPAPEIGTAIYYEQNIIIRRYTNA